MKCNTKHLHCLTMALAARAQARDFRSADVHPTDYPTVEAVRHMGKEVAEQSKGKMGVKVFPNGALGSERDTDRAAEDRRARHDAASMPRR
jgi:TRAP-type C4-dicarboxylate transport system substrate-binding protein